MRTNYGDLPLQLVGHNRVRSIDPSQKSSTPSAYGRFRSKLEASYADYLENLRRVGLIDGWWYEPVNFRLPGQRNFYKPDFLVQLGGVMVFYEVKGRNMSDDRSLVKIKTAAGCNAWASFRQVRRRKGAWYEIPIIPFSGGAG